MEWLESVVVRPSASVCVRTVSRTLSVLVVGLAFERKADAPSYCKQPKMEVSSDSIRSVMQAACWAAVLGRPPPEGHRE